MDAWLLVRYRWAVACHARMDAWLLVRYRWAVACHARMDAWLLVRYLHVLALAFFVGGQLVLVAAVVPALRRSDPGALRGVARRFGAGSAVALAVLAATGAAMAWRLERWGDPLLQAKLGGLAVIAVLVAAHVAVPRSRWLAAGVGAASLGVAYLGVRLAH